MGWVAIYKDGKIEHEDDTFTNDKGEIEGVGRPVDAGNNGELVVIAQEDFGHTVAIDLMSGVIAIDYEGSIGVQNGTIELTNVKTYLLICDETNIIGDLRHISSSEPDDQGNYENTYTSLSWRPIWFTRWTNGIPVKVIGAQTTLPETHNGKNLQKMVLIFPDGRIGIS